MSFLIEAEEYPEADSSGEDDLVNMEYDTYNSEYELGPQNNVPRQNRKKRSPQMSVYTSHQSVNPFSSFGFSSSMSSCRDGPNFHECTTVTNRGGNRRNGQGGEKTVITKVGYGSLSR